MWLNYQGIVVLAAAFGLLTESLPLIPQRRESLGIARRDRPYSVVQVDGGTETSTSEAPPTVTVAVTVPPVTEVVLSTVTVSHSVSSTMTTPTTTTSVTTTSSTESTTESEPPTTSSVSTEPSTTASPTTSWTSIDTQSETETKTETGWSSSFTSTIVYSGSSAIIPQPSGDATLRPSFPTASRPVPSRGMTETTETSLTFHSPTLIPAPSRQYA